MCIYARRRLQGAAFFVDPYIVEPEESDVCAPPR